MQNIDERIKAIDWEKYETFYGNANEDVSSDNKVIPKTETLLLALFSNDHQEAMKSTHYLWCELCYQYAHLSSAALPAAGFILYGLRVLDDELKVELLDIVRGMVILTSDDLLENTWQRELRKIISDEKELFIELSKSEDADISGFAGDILEALSK